MEPAKAGSSRGPMVGPQVETPNSFLMAVKKAPTSGTRWHNPPGTKKWNEAQTELSLSNFQEISKQLPAPCPLKCVLKCEDAFMQVSFREEFQKSGCFYDICH